MNLLMPCAGRSSRFETRLPKYLLSMPDGRLMFECAIQPFLAGASRIIFAILREHDNDFQAGRIIQELIPGSEVLVLEEVTSGQAATVQRMLEHFGVTGSILVKDSDSYFQPLKKFDSDCNYVSVCSAREQTKVKLHNKSFTVINDQGYILGTVEKEITSEFFSCGGYVFADATAFTTAYRNYRASSGGSENFLSHIIDSMIGSGHFFQPMHCADYEDWGTFEDWVAYRKRVATYLFDLDGVVYENGSQYWSPRWGETKLIQVARDKVNSLYDQGNYVVLVTSRASSNREATLAQLKRDGVKYHQLIMGVYHGARVLVNDFSPTNPYPTAVAINTTRDSGDFVDKI